MEIVDNIWNAIREFVGGVGEAFGETITAIMSDTDRLIGIFAIPLVATVGATAAQYTVLLNQQKTAIFAAFQASGVCATYKPYLITSMLGSYQGDALAHVGMCQAYTFNPLVFGAWFGEFFILVFAAIFVFEALTHNG